MRTWTHRAAAITGLLCWSATAGAATLQVGPGQTYAAPCQAIAAAKDGDTIEIDAAGTYSGDVCAVAKNALTLVGVNGRPKIDAASKNAQGKGTWVVTGNDVVVDNIELTGAKVPDANGAGIRQEGKNLTVRRSYFHDNENGILSGDGASSTITIENSEFSNNGAGDGLSHNLYIGKVGRLVFRFNYSHHAKVGHLLKSRALENLVLYNRLSDEATSTASYEINLPSAGTSYVIGNVIEQGPQTGNSAIVDYGSEAGTFNAATDLYVVNNTIVNNRPSGGTFVQVGASVSTPAKLINNVFFGPGTITNQASAQQTTNYNGATPMFVDAAAFDFRIAAGSPCANAGTAPGTAGAMSLVPTFHYAHPASSIGRSGTVGSIDIGAYEQNGDVPLADGGAPAGDGGLVGGPPGAGGGAGDGGASGDPSAGAASDDMALDSGCDCRTAGSPRASLAWLVAAVSVFGMRCRRRLRE